MAEEGLDGAEVGAVHEKVGCKRVTERMGGNMFCDAGFSRIFFDDALDRARS